MLRKIPLLPKIIVIVILIVIAGTVYFFVNKAKKDSYGCFVSKGYSWCDFKKKCVKSGEEDCVLTPVWILNEAQKAIGSNLNVLPDEVIEWITEEGKIAFRAQGIYSIDLLKSENITKWSNSFVELLGGIGMKGDVKNPAVSNEKEDSAKYVKEKVVCSLKRVDNPNSASSLTLSCGNIDDRLCNFNSDAFLRLGGGSAKMRRQN